MTIRRINDGVGVVLFLTLLGMITTQHENLLDEALMLFLKEAVFGLLFSFVLGWHVVPCAQLIITRWRS